MNRYLLDVNAMLAFMDPSSDLYLLALAVSNGAKFATFDTRIPAEAVAGGTEALERIPGT